jgi:hypothetical protein
MTTIHITLATEEMMSKYLFQATYVSEGIKDWKRTRPPGDKRPSRKPSRV